MVSDSWLVNERICYRFARPGAFERFPGLSDTERHKCLRIRL